MKKKLAAALLAAAMLMASLAGCGAPSTSQPTEVRRLPLPRQKTEKRC